MSSAPTAATAPGLASSPGPVWLGFLAGGLGFFPSLGITWPAQIPVTKTIAALATSGLATLFLVLKLLIGFHSASRSVGLFIALVAVIVQVVFAALAFKESGEALPTKADFQGLTGGGSTPPAQSYTPPPAAGYSPPPPPAGGFAAPPSFGTPPPAEPPASWQQPTAE